MFANASDDACPRGIAQTHLLVKQETRGLQNALVTLERDSRRVMPTRLQARLVMDGCQLLPRVQWIPLGSSLALINKDPARHQLIAMQGDNQLFEADLPPDGAPLRRPFVVPGMYEISCRRHLWERAWVYVSPHDSVALTDSLGEFSMKNVPIGRYAIRVWHEGWKTQGVDRSGRPRFSPVEEVQEITVHDQETSRMTFENLTATFTGAVPQ